MIIPESFEVGPYKFEVSKSRMLSNNHNLSGMVNYTSGQILLEPSDQQSRNYIETSFIHEMVHTILYTGVFVYPDGKKINDDEDFVERFSTLLTQALNTMKGDIDRG